MNPTAPTLGVSLKAVGRHLPRERYQRGSLRKIGKRRKMWEGRFQVYVRLADGKEKRRDRTKILGLVSEVTKTEAQKKLDDEISRSTGQPSPGGLPPNPTFAQLWTRYAELKKASWGTSTAKTVRAVFAGEGKNRKAPTIVSIIGHRRIAELTYDPLQALLNHVAERGSSLSTLKAVRTYLAASLEYAVSERVLEVNPARDLQLPTRLLTKRPCGRYLSIEEVQAVLALATGPEHLALALLFACGLRPQELLALRDDDVSESALRIDEAIKEKERGEKRLGSTKSLGSTGYVSLPDSIYREIQICQMTRADIVKAKVMPPGSPFLFPTSRGTPHRVGNYLRRILKPLAKTAGIPDFTFQACRRTCATHFQRHGGVRDAQAHLRHAALAVTGLYMKEIPEQIKTAVDSLYRELAGKKMESVN